MLVYASLKKIGLTLLFPNHRVVFIYQNVANLEEVLKEKLQDVDQMVTFGYTWKNIVKWYPQVEKEIKFISLKKKFLAKFPEEKLPIARGKMAEKVNIIPFDYEKTYPKASGAETCRLYQAIWNKINT